MRAPRGRHAIADRHRIPALVVPAEDLLVAGVDQPGMGQPGQVHIPGRDRGEQLRRQVQRLAALASVAGQQPLVVGPLLAECGNPDPGKTPALRVAREEQAVLLAVRTAAHRQRTRRDTGCHRPALALFHAGEQLVLAEQQHGEPGSWRIALRPPVERALPRQRAAGEHHVWQRVGEGAGRTRRWIGGVDVRRLEAEARPIDAEQQFGRIGHRVHRQGNEGGRAYLLIHAQAVVARRERGQAGIGEADLPGPDT